MPNTPLLANLQKGHFPEGPSTPVPRTETDVDNLPPKYHEIALRGLVRRQGHELRHDSLTGALTAKEFEDAVQKDRQEHPDAKRGLIFVDLGNFKKANGKNGSTQAIGDNVLRVVASLFSREGDLISRLGGDEFGLYVDLASRLTDQPPTTQAVLDNEIHRITSLRDPIVEIYPNLDEGNPRFFIAAGGLEYDSAHSYEENLQEANIAMGVNKEAGYEIYGQYRVADTIA
jgi:diguanylate cyclase (GGDEF)-like protein